MSVATESSDNATLPRTRLVSVLPLWARPSMVMAALWGGTTGLYLLGLSGWLRGRPESAISLSLLVVGSFMLGSGVWRLAMPGRRGALTSLSRREATQRLVGLHVDDSARLDLARNRVFGGFGGLVIVETIVAGLPPLVASVFGQAVISYREYGIQTVHGIVIALGIAAATLSTVRLLTGAPGSRRPDLAVLATVATYSVCILNRKMLVVWALQAFVYFVLTRQLRRRLVFGLVAGVMAGVVMFGFVGSLRASGGDITTQARMDSYPDWAPTGPIWVYAYLTTSFENLRLLTTEFGSEGSASVERTLQSVVPSGLRGSSNAFREVNASRYWLATSSFNVSTAYEPVYRDAGVAGIVAFNGLVAGVFALLLSGRASVGRTYAYVVLLQCLLLTIFTNNFFAPNNVGQLPVVAAALVVPRLSIVAPSSDDSR